MSAALRRSRGFSLIEVLVSVFVIGASIALLGTATLMTRVAREARLEETALRVANGELEALRALPYEELPGSGAFSNPQFTALPSSTGYRYVTSYDDSTKELEVVVSWMGSTGTSTVSVTTLRTESGGL